MDIKRLSAIVLSIVLIFGVLVAIVVSIGFVLWKQINSQDTASVSALQTQVALQATLLAQKEKLDSQLQPINTQPTYTPVPAIQVEATPINTPLPTPTPPPASTWTPTFTPQPAPTWTPTVPPPTPVPTNTPVPPTETFTPTRTPTNTPTLRTIQPTATRVGQVLISCSELKKGETRQVSSGTFVIGDIKVNDVIQYDIGSQNEGTVAFFEQGGSVTAEWGAGCYQGSEELLSKVIQGEFEHGCGSKCTSVSVVIVRSDGQQNVQYYSK